MKDVVRTWFLDDILSWYGAFNRVRNTVFEQHELRQDRFQPAPGCEDESCRHGADGSSLGGEAA